MLRILNDLNDLRQELQRLRTLSPPDWFFIEPVVTVLKQVQASKFATDPTLPPLITLSGSQIDAAYQQISQNTLAIIRQASYELGQLFRQQLPRASVQFGQGEQVRGQRFYPVQRAGIYLANGEARQLGVFLQQGLLANAVGVPERILMIDGDASTPIAPALLVAAQEMGIEAIYSLPGATAIAALALGYETLSPVEAIMGVGSAAVMWAKQLVSGWITVDQPLGETPWMLVADETANVRMLALDFIAQAEQDPQGRFVILVPDQAQAEAFTQWVGQYCREQEQSIATEKAISHYGVVAVVPDTTTWAGWINQFAPQTLVLALEDPWELVEKIQRAATIFLGQRTIPQPANYASPHPILRYSLGTFRSASRLSLQCFLRASHLYDNGVQPYPAWVKRLSQLETVIATQVRLGLEGS